MIKTAEAAYLAGRQAAMEKTASLDGIKDIGLVAGVAAPLGLAVNYFSDKAIKSDDEELAQFAPDENYMSLYGSAAPSMYAALGGTAGLGLGAAASSLGASEGLSKAVRRIPLAAGLLYGTHKSLQDTEDRYLERRKRFEDTKNFAQKQIEQMVLEDMFKRLKDNPKLKKVTARIQDGKIIHD